MILHGDLPPVGDKIALRVTAENKLASFLPENQYWLDSGTSALALALLDAKAKFPHLTRPRAIIPGYCCPDLVAACVYAGIEPVAIDIQNNDPAYDLDQLRISIDETVVAIIAINFLGVAERLLALRELISGLGLQTCLIEDNAQWFPASRAEMNFSSDYVTFSFGRGKPLSLLGGGLLLSKSPLADAVLQKVAKCASNSKLTRIKIVAYNWLLNPRFYMLLNRNPFLRLGETKYNPLEKIELLDSFRFSLLTENFNLYSKRNGALPQRFNEITAWGLQRFGAVHSLRCRQLLRYPLLCADGAARDALLERMRRAGLGVTAMYKLPIDQIEGVSNLVSVPAPLINAKSFADRLMTLPVHSGVSSRFQKRILSCLNRHDA